MAAPAAASPQRSAAAPLFLGRDIQHLFLDMHRLYLGIPVGEEEHASDDQDDDQDEEDAGTRHGLPLK
jgi:hypothetical protein